MARNISDMIGNVGRRLGSPRAQSPSDDTALLHIFSQVRTLLRAKQNVSVQWNYGETFVDITPDEATYQITDASFGTPLVVTTVPQSASDIVRIVPFYCPQNLEYSWGYPQNAGSWNLWAYSTSNCNAARCAIFWQNNLPYIRFEPIPALSPASYKIAFLANANQVGQLALTATPLMDQDCDLVEIRAARSLLAVSEWDAATTPAGRATNAEKRKDLFVTLANDDKLAYEQFLIGNRISTGGNRISNRWSSVEV